MKSANSNSSCCFSGPAAALTLLPKGVSQSHPRQKMSPNLTNQYCCLDTLHLPRCFAGIPRRSSKKGKRTANSSPMQRGQAAPLRSCYDDCSQQSSSAEAFVFSTLHHLQGASFTTLINEKTR